MRVVFNLSILLLAILTSCRGGPIEDQTSTSPTTGNTPGADQPVQNSAGFNIRVEYNSQTPSYSYILHQGDGSTSDNFESSCSIDSLAAASTDIKCILEANEVDLYSNGAGFRVNVPQSMCEYLEVSRPYYYNFKPGQGPSLVIDNRTNVGSVTVAGQTVPAGQLWVSGGLGSLTSLYCPFDYSNESNPDYMEGGPNCCTGSYDIYTVSVTVGATSADTTVTVPPAVRTSWGGKASNCIYGPATTQDDFAKFNSDGTPSPQIFNVQKSGFNKGYLVKAPKSLDLPSNVYAANYFNPSDHGGTVPLAFRSQGSPSFPTTEPYHKFVCYDRAFEVKARIRVMVREWNLISEYEKKEAGDPDTAGSESGFDSPQINDYKDLKDLGNTSTSFPKERHQ